MSTQAFVISFDDDSPRQGKPGQRVITGDTASVVAVTLHETGLDASASLYNDALELAQERHLVTAASTLQVLLGLDPDDPAALLLLAKVEAAQGRPRDARALLDRAVGAGVADVPKGFRKYLEDAIRDEEERQKNELGPELVQMEVQLNGLRRAAAELREEADHVKRERDNLRRGSRRGTALTLFFALMAGFFGTIMVTFIREAKELKTELETSKATVISREERMATLEEANKTLKQVAGTLGAENAKLKEAQPPAPPADQDGDGVLDPDDKCRNTPTKAVGPDGCDQIDYVIRAGMPTLDAKDGIVRRLDLDNVELVEGGRGTVTCTFTVLATTWVDACIKKE